MRGETITILRQDEEPSGEDSQRNPIYARTPLTVEHCAFAPASSGETLDHFGRRVITGGTVYAPSGTEFRPDDILVIRGDEYVADGEAGQWTNPYSGVGRGVEIAVKRGS